MATMGQTRRINLNQGRELIVRSMSCCLWVHAQGFPILRCEMSNDGTGSVVYVFPGEAAPAFNTYLAAKDHINGLAMKARSAQ